MNNIRKRVRRCTLLALASTTMLASAVTLLLPLTGLGGVARAAEATVNYSIPVMPLRDALLAFSKQSNIQVIIATDSVDGRSAAAVVGRMTASQALDALLRDHHLEYVFTGTGTVTVRVKSATPKRLPATISEPAPPPKASSDVGLQLEALIVTAQKRSESIQDVPISTTAFTHESMKRLGFQSATDVAAMAPNVNIQNSYGATNANIFIRGVGDASFHVNQVGAVGIYQDEVSLNSPAVNMFQVFDLERIEVLRGPQNSLYGRNTTGGAINYISRKPGLDDGLNADVALSYGRFNQFDVDAAVGAPLSDNSALRLSMSSSSRDAWMRNVTLRRDEEKEDRYAARLQYLVRPSNALEMLFNIHGGVNRGDGARYKSIGQLDAAGNQCPTAPASKVGGGCSDMFGFADNDNFRQNFANLPNPRAELNADGASANVSWKLDGVTITSLTAYEGNRQKRNEDTDAGPYNIWEFYQQEKQAQYSEELRAASTRPGPLQWIAGGYYFKEDLTASTVTAARFAGRGGSTQAILHDEVWSAYGQGSYDFTERWKFTVGARYSAETKDGTVNAYAYDPTGIALGTFIGREQVVANAFRTLPTIPVDKTWRDWGGKLGLDYKLNADAMLYGNVSRGFKGGNVNLAAQQALFGFDNFSVNPEHLMSYEFGAKTSWLDRKLRANLALFVSKYTDQQVSQIADGTLLLTNAGRSTIKGGEFELNWSPDSTWLINAGLGFTHARFDDFQFAPGINYAGKKLAMVPEVSVSGLVRKQFRIDDNILGLQLDFSHLGSQEFDVGNDPRFTEPSRTITNARVSYDFGAKREYSFVVWGKNLGSVKYCTSRSDMTFVGMIACTPSEPTTYGATLRYRFN